MRTRRLLWSFGGVWLSALLAVGLVWGSGHHTTAGGILYGDANCDGRANSLDALLVLQLDAGIISGVACPEQADVNRDGHADSMDASLILQYHAGLLPVLPPDSLANIPTTCEASLDLPDGTILANDILARESGNLLLDRPKRDELAAEIDHVVNLIRADNAEVANIRVLPRYVPGVVMIQPEPALADKIWELAAAGPTVTFITSYAQLDALNAALGLQGFYPIGHVVPVVLLCFPDNLNVSAAAATFEALDGVLSANPYELIGDGPDIKVARQEDSWYAVFRDAEGDCPAGCIPRRSSTSR